MGSTSLRRVVCGVAPQTSFHKLLSPNGAEMMVKRSFRRDVENSTRDACAPQIQLHGYGVIAALHCSTSRLRRRGRHGLAEGFLDQGFDVVVVGAHDGFVRSADD
jgi:hypothetical protein